MLANLPQADRVELVHFMYPIINKVCDVLPLSYLLSQEIEISVIAASCGDFVLIKQLLKRMMSNDPKVIEDISL